MRWLRFVPVVSQIAALALVLGLALLSWRSISSLLANQAWLEHTHVVVEQLSAIETSIADVQRSARGFAITGDESMIAPYRIAVAELRLRVQALGRETQDNAVQQQSVQRLERDLVPLFAHYERLINARRVDAEAATAIVRSGVGVRQVAKLQEIIDRMQTAEQEVLAERTARSRTSAKRTAWVVVFGAIAAVLAVSTALFLNQQEMRHRIAAQRSAVSTAEELAKRIAEGEQRAQQVRILAILGEYLQLAETEAEAGSVAVRHLPELLPHTSGELFAIGPARDSLESIGSWAYAGDDERTLTPADCWALRKGTVHQTTGNGMRCRHLRGSGSSLCLPMTANGEMVGLVSIEWEKAVDLPRDTIELARSAAEQISLAYSSIALREELRRQAIRDPLTSLFNRRYAEESLAREIGRASRRNTAMSVMLIDVDRFKEYNDALGHGAGDRLLREIAAVIVDSTRTEDVAARYGGDEFMIILSDTAIDSARVRAQEIARSVRAIAMTHPETGRGPSVSIGVSSYPDHGDTAAAIVESADRALYAAKQRGRDRVECARAA